jgi:hypothetical protein
VQSEQQNVPAAVTLAQLVVFNSVRHKHTSANHSTNAVQHSREQETPLPFYVGLAVHAATRKKRLVGKLFSLGICISYDRIISVLDELVNAVYTKAEKVVYPVKFHMNVFTPAAVDNIDHNPSSTTA